MRPEPGFIPEQIEPKKGKPMIKNDMLVNLLKLPTLDTAISAVQNAGVTVRRADPWEITLVRDFVQKEFGAGWADEISVGFARQPISVYIAVEDNKVVGIAGYECTRRAYFGPTGVAQSARGKGIGKALMIAALHGLREMGYVYGIIGSAEDPKAYTKAVGAVEIQDSAPGIYANLI